jgi:hypothetical protein
MSFNYNQYIKEYQDLVPELSKHIPNIENIIKSTNENLEGNCFYVHNSLDFYEELLTKQINIYASGKQGPNICEIGFNAGHSALLMLLNHPSTTINFTIFDIGIHKYTKPTLEYLKTSFPNTTFNYIEGNSIETMPKYIADNDAEIYKYNVVHVDGGHSLECIINDAKNADMLLAINGLMIIDDTNINYINKIVEEYIADGRYIELDILQTTGYKHRIMKKIKNLSI